MHIVVLSDETNANARTHATAQIARLRERGVAVATRQRSASGDRTVDAFYAIGAGQWRAARRAARGQRTPVVYDHPPGCPRRPKLAAADAVVASGWADAARLAPLLATGESAVVVPPVLEPPAVPARLRERLGIGGAPLAIQEAGTVTAVEAEALVEAIASLADLDLVFLGGERWAERAAVAVTAERVGASDRVHFVAELPSTRRVAYLSEADVGLALAGRAGRRDVLAAADVFHALGIPFVAAARDRAAAPPDGVFAAAADADALRAAIHKARTRQPAVAGDDGGQTLEGMLVGLAARGPRRRRRLGRRAHPLLPRVVGKVRSIAVDGGSATARLASARALRARGEHEAAIEAYEEVARGAYPVAAVAAAAVGLARLRASSRARAALEVVLDDGDRPALASARAGEALAVLGDLALARELAEAALAEPDVPAVAQRAALRVLEQVGELSAALAVAERCGDGPSVARIEGTLRSYDPGWLPARSGAGSPRPATVGRVFTLLESALPHARSGYTYRARTLIRAQRDVGLDPIVLTRLGFPANRGVTAPATEDVDGVVHHHASLPGVDRYTSVPMSDQLAANVRWASALGRELAPELVIATTPHLNGIVGLSLRDELGVPLIYDVRGFPEMTWAVRGGGGESEVYALRRAAETRCMREADLVTTLSETMRGHIVSRGVDRDKVVVLPHAVDTDAFAPVARDDVLAGELGLDGRFVIAYISSLVAYEGVETLLDAVALARRSNSLATALIVGDGELLPALRARADRRGLGDHVVFTGRVDAAEVARYYSLADVFVCPRHDHEVTRYVTPLKPFEAMAAGCCLAVSDLPTLREAVRDGECGALFPAGDADALATTILALADDPRRRAELGAAAREHAHANHGLASLRAALGDARARLGLPALASDGPSSPTASVPLA